MRFEPIVYVFDYFYLWPLLVGKISYYCVDKRDDEIFLFIIFNLLHLWPSYLYKTNLLHNENNIVYL